MSSSWYELVAGDQPLTQGDIIEDCPIVRWAGNATAIDEDNASEILKELELEIADVIVMSQACDLEYDKVRNVILCPHVTVEFYRDNWERAEKDRGSNPTKKAWKNRCDDICAGYIWNLAMLNSHDGQPIRIVDFHEVYTAPKDALESLLVGRNRARRRLLPPYREHVSQAFARFFMRVGLPMDIQPTW